MLLKISLQNCHGSDPSSHESNKLIKDYKFHFIKSLEILCYKFSNGIVCNIFKDFIAKIAMDQILLMNQMNK